MKKLSIVLSVACFMLAAFSLVNQANAGCHRKAVCCVPCCTPCCDEVIEVTVCKPERKCVEVEGFKYVVDCDNCCCCVKGKHCKRVVCCCPLKKVPCKQKVWTCTKKTEKQLMKLTTVCVRTGCFKKHCKVVCCYTPVCKAEACKDADQPKRADNPQSKKQEVKPNVPAAAPKAPVKK